MINLKAIKGLPKTAIRAMGPAGLKLQKYSPEILLGVGVIGVIGGTALACKATLKLETELEEHKARLDEVHAEIPEGDPEEVKELTKVYFATGGRIIKLYAPASAAMTVGLACIIGSHNIQAGRIAGLAAAYSAATTTLDEYRGRVREEIGEEKELDIYRNVGEGEIEVTKTLKSGKEKVVKQKVPTLDPDHRSMYTFIFDESNPNFVRGGGYNKRNELGVCNTCRKTSQIRNSISKDIYILTTCSNL